MKPLNIVFAGTPAFTLPSLDALFASKHRIKAVYTQPDRPKGRGKLVQASAAKDWALSHNIPVYQPLNLKDQSSQDELKSLHPDIIVVIAYGLILPQSVLSIPRLGCMNVHASLLPQYRGAAPIQYALLNGDTTTGISIMKMDPGMDTGPIYSVHSCPILPHMSASDLHDQLAKLAADPLIAVLDQLASNPSLMPIPQNNSIATYAPKIIKQQALIDWSHPAIQIERQIRAFNPWPIAQTNALGQIIRVYRAHVISENVTEEPGTILSLSTQGMLIATGDEILNVTNIQFAGGKVISIAEWLNAHKKNLYPGLVLK